MEHVMLYCVELLLELRLTSSKGLVYKLAIAPLLTILLKLATYSQ